MIIRHPFPGPGLAIRILGEITAEQLKIARLADSIFIQEIVDAGLYRKISQAFAALLPVKAVGVMGDKRVHEQVIALRAVETTDFMTAGKSYLRTLLTFTEAYERLVPVRRDVPQEGQLQDCQ